ncbi:MAG: hypothetical protein AAGK78_07540, partial [Planctomycetota bacterium]
TDYAVRGASVMAAESVPTAGKVSFSGGLLHVEVGDAAGVDLFGEYHAATYVVPGVAAIGSDATPPPDSFDGGELSAPAAVRTAVAAGVTLLWDAGEVGCYMLETTRLPPRIEPYVLNIELARHRLMKLVHKQEDWGLWDIPQAKPALEMARQAQRTFAEALGLMPDHAAASQVADRSLSLAIEAGEALARVHADVMLDRRKKLRKGGIPRTVLGIRCDPKIQNTNYRKTLATNFDYAVLPIPWRALQPEEEVFLTDTSDQAVEFFARNRIPVVAGPLVDLTEGEVPEWLFIYEHEFETIRQLAFEFVRSVATRYRKVIKLWNVVGGLHAASSFGLTFEQMVELTRLLVGQVKSVIPTSKTLVTIRMPFGEYLGTSVGSVGSAAVPPMLYAEMVSQSGVEVDGFAVEIKTGVPKRGSYCRDLFQLSNMLDAFGNLNKPLFIHAVACPDRSTQSGGIRAADGGRWHDDWSPELQAKWMQDVYRIA